MDLFCYLCFVFVILSCRLFIAVLWSPAWRDHLLALLYAMFYCVFITFQWGARAKCCSLLYRFLIFASFLTLRNESKIILSFKWCPKDCCLAHRRRKLFNIGGGGGGKASEANFNTCGGVLQKCTYTHACTHA